MTTPQDALLLDLDGPLLDPRPALLHALNRALDGYEAISSPEISAPYLNQVIEGCESIHRGWLCSHLLRWAASHVPYRAWTGGPAPTPHETVDTRLARTLIDSAYLGEPLHKAVQPGPSLPTSSKEGHWRRTEARTTREQLSTLRTHWRLALFSDRSPGETIHVLAHHGWLGCFEAIAASIPCDTEDWVSAAIDHALACLDIEREALLAVTTLPMRATRLRRAGVKVMGLVSPHSTPPASRWPDQVPIISSLANLMPDAP